MHIIWNIFLMDKEHILTEDEVTKNNVAHILAILPSDEEYTQTTTCSHAIMPYDGHSMDIDTELYDTHIKTIESFRAERKNVGSSAALSRAATARCMCQRTTCRHADRASTRAPRSPESPAEPPAEP